MAIRLDTRSIFVAVDVGFGKKPNVLESHREKGSGTIVLRLIAEKQREESEPIRHQWNEEHKKTQQVCATFQRQFQIMAARSNGRVGQKAANVAAELAKIQIIQNKLAAIINKK